MPTPRSTASLQNAAGWRGARVRLRTWRRSLTALSRAVGQSLSGDDDARALLAPGPHAKRFVLDKGPWRPSARPRQGRLGDCWVMASMLAVHETAPERLQALMCRDQDGTVTVHLPGAQGPVTVDRLMPADAAGTFVYGRQDSGSPGWVGVLEKAVALQVAGGYRFLQRGFGKFGLELLLGEKARTLLLLPSARQIVSWRAEHRAILASTHPLSGRVGTAHGTLPANHVFAVVGAEPSSGHVLLRNPVRPGRVLRVDARTFRRGFISVDVTAPLR